MKLDIYEYFVCYYYEEMTKEKSSIKIANCKVCENKLIEDFDQVREIEEYIEAKNNLNKVIISNFQLLKKL